MSAALGVSGAVAACSGGGGPATVLTGTTPTGTAQNGASPGSAAPSLGETGSPSTDPLAGITQDMLTPLQTPPAFDDVAMALTITVAPGELGMISINSFNNQILVNGVNPVGATNQTHATSANLVSVSIVESAPDAALGTKTTEFIVDYSNGLFALGQSLADGGSGGGINLALSGSEPILFGIKGTNSGVLTDGGPSGGADTFVFGANGVNMNGDALADITWAANGGASTFVVSMGLGDDSWSGAGDQSTGTTADGGAAPFDNSNPSNPVPGYGKGVVVYGGAGNDYFDESSVVKYETIYGGGQAGDTVDYGARSAAVNVTLSLPGVANIVSGNCANAGSVYSPCTTDEFDDIKNDVFVVNGGGGNDFLVASTGLFFSPVVDAGVDSGTDAGRADAGDAGHADAGDAGHADAGDAGRADAAADSGTDSGFDSGLNQGPDAGVASVTLQLNGGAGNDVFVTYGGPYVVHGGAGDDTFVMGVETDPHGGGTVCGNDCSGTIAGVDSIDFSQRTRSVHVTMDGTTSSGTWNTVIITEGVIVGADVSNLHGGSGDDLLNGNALNNVINGGPGTDVMQGLGGTDTADYSDRTGVTVWAAIDGIAHSGAATMTPVHGDSYHGYTNGSCALGTSSENDLIALDFSNISGSQGNDCLFGQPINSTCSVTYSGVTTATICQNTLTGGPGDDMLFGYDDDDFLDGTGGVGGDSPTNSNFLDCGASGVSGNTGFGTGLAGYKASCQF